MIFLCSDSADQSRVEAIYDRLLEEGLTPWMSARDLLAGQKARIARERVLSSARFVIIFFSRQSFGKRGDIQRQYKQVLDILDEIPDNEIFLIPVRLDDCNVPADFADIHSADLYREHGFDQIIKTILSQLSNVEQNDVVGASYKRYKQVTQTSGAVAAVPGTRIDKWSIIWMLVPILVLFLIYWIAR